MTHIALADGAEFDRIRELLGIFGGHAVGIGDDAAQLVLPPGEALFASVDATVEDVHFRAHWVTPAEVGWRAVQAALSDLAAMGATPVGVLLAWCLPAHRTSWLAPLADGTLQAVRDAGVPIVGGNLTLGSTLCLTTTVLGHARHGVSRAGARVGDVCYVTGELGGPGAAVAAWQGAAEPSPAARERFVRPRARLLEGQWLAAHGASAMVDISDGLVGDARHLAAASAVAIRIDQQAIPLVPGTTAEQALRSGEEYELFVTAPAIDIAAFRAATGTRLTPIGQVVMPTEGPSVLVEVAGDSSARVDSTRGHDHFS
jgi:thiamine-monophosphate kinase